MKTLPKLAILQVADSGPLESLVVMLRSAGIDCALPSTDLKNQLRDLKCDTVVDVDWLVREWGYDQPMELPIAGPVDMERRDVLYVDTKGHRNGPLVWGRWPHLKDRTLWYRINGGKPEHVIRKDGFDCGDEVNPPCPVLTPNQWYKDGAGDDLAYTCWPPFHRVAEYDTLRTDKKYDAPICLIHYARGWGYETLFDRFRDGLGVKIYGRGSPDGLISHREVGARLTSALAMVHLKSNDAPGYAIYEAMAAGCPIICTRRLIWRCRMQELLEPGVTCLAFDRETHDGLSQEDAVACYNEVDGHLESLRDQGYNRKIGNAGKERLRSLLWREDRDGVSLRNFMERNFGCA